MEATRFCAVVSLILLLTVMFGGYSLLRLFTVGPELSAFQRTYFRAGHAHAGVLLVFSLIYYQYLDQTAVGGSWRWAACIVLLVGIAAQSGGFFLHIGVGRPDSPSVGTRLTTAGAVLLAVAILFLAYALIWQYAG